MTEEIPPCVASMGCLCAGHARGNDASAPCELSESVEAMDKTTFDTMTWEWTTRNMKELQAIAMRARELKKKSVLLAEKVYFQRKEHAALEAIGMVAKVFADKVASASRS